VSRSVLIVDDEPLIARTLSNALREAGFDTQTASTAEAAEGKLFGESVSVDIIIVDNRLPKGSGLALLKRLRARNLDVKLILMTAYDSPEVKAEARQLGVHRYVKKPFDLGRMIAEVEDLVGTDC
jgi:DNA-binding response OmpR family regulator